MKVFPKYLFEQTKMGSEMSKEIEVFSVPVSNPQKSGRGPIYRAFYSTEKLISNTKENVRTLYDNFHLGSLKCLHFIAFYSIFFLKKRITN